MSGEMSSKAKASKQFKLKSRTKVYQGKTHVDFTERVTLTDGKKILITISKEQGVDNIYKVPGATEYKSDNQLWIMYCRITELK